MLVYTAMGPIFRPKDLPDYSYGYGSGKLNENVAPFQSLIFLQI